MTSSLRSETQQRRRWDAQQRRDLSRARPANCPACSSSGPATLSRSCRTMCRWKRLKRFANILQGFDCFCKIADTCLVRVGWWDCRVGIGGLEVSLRDLDTSPSRGCRRCKSWSQNPGGLLQRLTLAHKTIYNSKAIESSWQNLNRRRRGTDDVNRRMAVKKDGKVFFFKHGKKRKN